MPKRTEKLNLSEHTLDINTRKFDIEFFDYSEIEEFVNVLCGNRQYQIDAIKQIMTYLWGGGYKDLTELAKENFKRKDSIRQRFQTEDMFLAHLPLPDRLSGVCHMATGTGKSYVMFAIAYLSIVLGKAKRVMVIGPSSTIIEEGLNDKFKEYINGEQGQRLQQTLPADYRNIPVNILNCNDPIEDNSIVIENINAIYSKDRNAIGDTLFSHGGEVLVLSDEVHHAYSHLEFSQNHLILDDSKSEERLWMKYIREEPLITRHIGFTGTPYNADEYFADVLFNYSIRDAIDEKQIKDIKAIIHTESSDGDIELTLVQRYEVIIETHYDNREKYAYRDSSGSRRVKPITIFINSIQKSAQDNSEEFAKALADYLKQNNPDLSEVPRSALEEEARKKIICVISKLDESGYKLALERIEEIDSDKPGGQVEFIFAVNKLSEGWDVDNVFQIVPMQERVFNSKLLISQVLGRGLRIPRQVTHTGIMANYPIVTITNHEKFANHIQELLDQVTECEMRMTSGILDESQERYKHNFGLFNLQYVPRSRHEQKETDGSAQQTIRTLLLTPFAETLDYKVTYTKGSKQFELSRSFYTVDQVVAEITDRFANWVFENQQFDFGSGFVLDKVPGRSDIKEIVLDAMGRAGIEGNQLSENNRQEINLFFNSYLPQGKMRVIRENIEGDIFGIPTKGMDKSSVRIGSLDDGVTAFISEDYDDEIGAENLFIIEQLEKLHAKSKKVAESGQASLFQAPGEYNKELIRVLIPNKNIFVVNTSLLKAPQNLVLVSHSPERDFVFQLIEHGRLIHSWIKSRDMDFYSLEYEFFKGGKDRVRRSFNPDFFIKIDLEDYLDHLHGKAPQPAIEKLEKLRDEGIETMMHVVEIKSDEDKDEVTRAKEKYGREHFEAVNKKLRTVSHGDIPEDLRGDKNQLYVFTLLRPAEYAKWFANLNNGILRD